MSAFGGKADSASLGRVHKELHLGLSQVFARPQICVGTPLRRNCSIYDAWRDQREVRFVHVFGPPSPSDWSKY
jgi:hypothetical protein